MASHPRLPDRTRAFRSLGASQPRSAAGPGSPAVPGLPGVGAAASMTPARSGPACPVHLDKLRLTGAQSLWSRRPPVASLPTQLPRAGSGQVAGTGRGAREARPLRRWSRARPAAGPLLPVRFWGVPGSSTAPGACPQASRLAALAWDSPGPRGWSLRTFQGNQGRRTPRPSACPCRTLGDFPRVWGTPSSRELPGLFYVLGSRFRGRSGPLGTQGSVKERGAPLGTRTGVSSQAWLPGVVAEQTGRAALWLG